MALVIPSATDYSLEKGDRGAAVFALQRVCNKFGIPTGEDGVFGDRTRDSVIGLQEVLGVVADGKAGPKTQSTLAALLTSRSEEARGLPKKILLSKVTYESGGYLGAVNHNTPGGVDCGLTQRRVYDEDYGNEAKIKEAFDAVYQVQLSAQELQERKSHYSKQPGVFTTQGAYRVAILHHNYPALAQAIGKYGISPNESRNLSGLPSYWKQPVSWVINHGLKFPDGAPIRTALEWGQRYALGNKDHNEPGQAVKLTEW